MVMVMAGRDVVGFEGEGVHCRDQVPYCVRRRPVTVHHRGAVVSPVLSTERWT